MCGIFNKQETFTLEIWVNSALITDLIEDAGNPG
jgi:hypothetical protein